LIFTQKPTPAPILSTIAKLALLIILSIPLPKRMAR